MNFLKEELQERFAKAIQNLDISKENHLLEIDFHTISEQLFEFVKVKKEHCSIPLRQTSHDNICLSELEICKGKSDDVILDDIPTLKQSLNKKSSTQQNPQTTIPSNFSLTYEMKQFAKSKYIENVEEVFENFILYYQSKGILNSDWEAAWKKWVLNNNRFKNHLIKTTIDEEMELTNELHKVAQKYLPKDLIELEFTKFKNHYISNGDLKVSWERVWENWCINAKQYIKNTPSSTQNEKQTYKWNFKKAKEMSDKIKDWLQFEVKYDWLNLHFYKGEKSFFINTRQESLHIGITDMPHPDFNKKEILLFKIDSDDGQYLSNFHPIDIEVIEYD